MTFQIPLLEAPIINNNESVSDWGSYGNSCLTDIYTHIQLSFTAHFHGKNSMTDIYTLIPLSFTEHCYSKSSLTEIIYSQLTSQILNIA